MNNYFSWLDGDGYMINIYLVKIFHQYSVMIVQPFVLSKRNKYKQKKDDIYKSYT
jgi:hypothetical protein